MAEIAIAIVGLVAAVVAAWSKRIRESIVERFREERAKRSAREFFRDLVRYETGRQHSHALCERIGARRVIVLGCHNGGGYPRAGKPVRVSAFVEAPAEGVNPQMPHWLNREVGPHYRSMCIDIIEKGQLTVETDKLPRDSELFRLYTAEGVKCSAICQVGYDVELRAFVYMSCNLGHPTIDDATWADIEGTCNELRELFGLQHVPQEMLSRVRKEQR